jgi:hypothetical protein
VLLSPAAVELGTVHLLAGRTGVTGGDYRVVFIDDDSAEVPSQARTLAGAPGSKIEKIAVSVGSHPKNLGKARY